MKLIVCGDVAYKEETFFNAVRELLIDGDGMFVGNAEGDEIDEAFTEYLNEDYDAAEVWVFTSEDRERAVNNFIDCIFSWLSDDYSEVEFNEN